MRKMFFLMVFAAVAWSASAQESKIGFADVDYIFSQMPDAKLIDTELQSVQNQLKTQLDNKVKEFQTLLADYQANMNNMLPAIRANTEKELTQKKDNIEKLQQDAQTTIQQKQNQLMEPVYAKVGKAIEDVAKENNFTLILNQQIGGLDVILFGDEKMDVSDLVLKKMGITPTPPATPEAEKPKN
jgi:outer membrane protein